MNKNQKFIIQGLAGEKRLKGKVKINGAKNSALKAMAASILFKGDVVLNNIPNTEDIRTMMGILKDLGADIRWKADKVLFVNTDKINKTEIKKEWAKTMRASVVLTGPMLARFGKVSFPSPGGCVIGARPIDLFIDGYKKMGAEVNLVNDVYEISSSKDLKSSEILFNKISVGGTETLMMTAVLIKGKTVLKNCAKEPEIGNVAKWLNACGAKIEGIDTDTITIFGNGELLESKAEYVAIPDRIETGSFLILGALCAERLEIEDCEPDHLVTVIDLLKKSGVNIVTDSPNKKIIVAKKGNEIGSQYRAFNVTTKEYPGFPTDLQSPIVTYLTQAEGESSVEEKIFEGRFKYVQDLVELGAQIEQIDNDSILVKGPSILKSLENKELTAHDIRAGFAIVIASLIAKGQSTINNVHLIDRGYENLEIRLKAIGADIERVG